jgi:hypothetical protein
METVVFSDVFDGAAYGKVRLNFLMKARIDFCQRTSGDVR